MVTNNLWRASDLVKIHNIVQNAMILYPKEIVIATLREFFARDSFYRFVTDAFGFPLTPDQTNLLQTSGINDNLTTRLFIGENYRADVIYYPAILVKSGGSSSVPISMNRETGSVQWDFTTFQNSKGQSKSFKTPKSFIFAGAWEGSINIDILARDLRARDDLVDLVSLLFTDIAFNDLVKAGLVVKNVSAGGPSATIDRNDQLFSQTVTLQIRSEWRREIPISNVLEVINFVIDFGRTDNLEIPPALNLRIKTNETLQDILANL